WNRGVFHDRLDPPAPFPDRVRPPARLGARVMSPIQAALAYAAALGWPVFPRAGRVPLTAHGYKDASLDAEQIRAWWHQHPTALTGVATGPPGPVVLDIDRKGGVDGFETLEALGKALLPETPMAHTPSGGIHVYFAANPKLEIRCSTGVHGL